MARGTPVPPNLSAELQQVLGSLGDANCQERGFGHGSYVSGSTVGRRDSVWAFVVLAGSPISVEVPHALGRVPGWAKVHEFVPKEGLDGLPGITSINKSKWTSTTIQIGVHALAGTIDGVTVVLEIGGG